MAKPRNRKPALMNGALKGGGYIRLALLWLLGVLYLAAGFLHVVWPEPFLTIMPHWVPWPREVVAFTGLCEILGAAGLVMWPTRGFAGMALALYAVCVFPANVTHAMNDLSTHTGLGVWYHVPRLLLQPVIVWVTLYACSIVSWPVARRGERLK